MHKLCVTCRPSPCHLLAGLTTGIVVDAGATQTMVAPVLEGYVDTARMKRLHVGGDAVTRRLRQLVQQKVSSYDVAAARSADDALFERMKERCCYVAVHMDREMAVRGCTCVYRSCILTYAAPMPCCFSTCRVVLLICSICWLWYSASVFECTL